MIAEPGIGLLANAAAWVHREKENLKMMMNLLRDTSANIQFEAFHVFKVFVANPKKPEAISQILLNNREKLIAYLKNFQNSKGTWRPELFNGPACGLT